MCSRETVAAMVSRWPGLAGMDANDVLGRLMSLKARLAFWIFRICTKVDASQQNMSGTLTRPTQ